MPRPPHDHGIEHEPHFNGHGSNPHTDPSESKADRTLGNRKHKPGNDERAGHSVFDEPGIFPDDSAMQAVIDRDWYCTHCGYNRRGGRLSESCPECGRMDFTPPAALDKSGYARWLHERIEKTTEWQSWLTVLAITLAGGLFAIAGALCTEGGPMMLIVFGPVTEEVMKVAAAAIVVETKPYLIKRSGQLFAATLTSAAVFAVIENVLYLNVYIPNPSPNIVAWRWVICTAMHMTTAGIATVGVARVWERTCSQLRKPTLPIELQWLVLAIVIHGSYNALAVVLELSNWGF